MQVFQHFCSNIVLFIVIFKVHTGIIIQLHRVHPDPAPEELATRRESVLVLAVQPRGGAGTSPHHTASKLSLSASKTQPLTAILHNCYTAILQELYEIQIKKGNPGLSVNLYCQLGWLKTLVLWQNMLCFVLWGLWYFCLYCNMFAASVQKLHQQLSSASKYSNFIGTRFVFSLYWDIKKKIIFLTEDLNIQNGKQRL